MKTYNFIRIALLLSLLSIGTIYGQEIKETSNFFKISLTNTNYFPLQFKTQGVKLLESQISPSGEFGLAYFRKLPKDWGAEIGLSYSQIGYNYFFNFYSELTDYPQVDIENNFLRQTEFDYTSARFSLNLLGSKKFKLTTNHFLSSQFGVNINLYHSEAHIRGSIYENEQNKEYRFFYMYVESFVPIITHLSFTGKIGIDKYFNNQDFIAVNLVGTYAPTAILNGNFYFDNIDYDSKGTVKLRPSFIGIEVAYNFALKRKAPNKTYK